MKIDENYSVETDSNNFVLRFEKEIFNEKTNKKGLSTKEFYCVDLEHVCKIYLRECIREEINPNTQFQDLIKELTSVQKKIKELISQTTEN